MRAEGGAFGAGFGVAALGLAVLDVTAAPRPAEARQRPIDGVRLVETAPATSGDAYAIGRGRLAMGDLPGALAAFREALLAAPQSVDALNGMGVAYDRMGRPDLARALYDAALAIDPRAGQVLNNLGYSLYLQGQDHAAIPVLQQAEASDPAAAASARRLLALIADRLRTAAIASDLAATRAELGTGTAAENRAAGPRPPAMRIEVSSNGEQRLVIGGAAPAPMLVASLGDAAGDSLVASPWQASDDRRLAARDRAEAALAAAAATADVADLVAAEDAASVALLALQMGPTPAVTVPAPAATAAADPAPPPPPPRRRRNPGLRRPAPDTTLASAAAIVAPSPAILPLRRGDRAADGRASAGEGPHRDTATARFDSDDAELNAFAARIRTRPLARVRTAAVPLPVAIAVAIARLEQLIARARAA